MKILILGANGELGNKLYNYLRKDNNNEIVHVHSHMPADYQIKNLI